MNTDNRDHAKVWMEYAHNTGWDVSREDIAEWALCELYASIINNDGNEDIGLIPWCEDLLTSDIEWALSHKGDRSWDDIDDVWYQ